MKTRIAFVLFAVGCMSGCATMSDHQSAERSPVSPEADEELAIGHIVVLADASASMETSKLFFPQKELVADFAAMMPEGAYSAAIDSFSGTRTVPWQWNALEERDRPELLVQAEKLALIGDATRLGSALERLRSKLAEQTEPGALLVFSDGRTGEEQESILAAARDLIASHESPLCIFTVHLGDDPEGRGLLQALSDESGCGHGWTASDIDSIDGMDAMVRRIFFAPIGAPASNDSDGDGVLDQDDHCPNTPKGARVDERGCWVIRGLNFDSDSSVIKPEFHSLLNEIVDVLIANPSVTIRLDGHTDSDASAEYNMTLSESRAIAVRDYLIEKNVSASRVQTKGFGEAAPAYPNDSRANKYLNRRVEITVLSD